MTINPATRPLPAQEEGAAASDWSRRTRQLVSLAVLVHLGGVFVAPLAFACTTGRGSSPFADGLMRLYRPYVSALYLNHGYSFFAPNPGPSHLVRYRVEFDDGRAAVEGVFPDLKTQRPRLLYHRHFMLAEALYNFYAPPEEPEEPRIGPELAAMLSDQQRRQLEAAIHRRFREQAAAWKHARQQYEALRHSVERHLLAVHGGQRVTLTRLEHELLSAEEFAVLGRLDLPELMRELPEGAPAPEVIRPGRE